MRRTLCAIVFLAGCSCATTSMPTTQKSPPTVSSEGFIDAGSWKASRHDATLRVEGVVTVAATNYSPALEFDSLSKSNPPELALKILVNKTGDFGGQMISDKTVRYESQDRQAVKAIHILYPDGRRHTITEIAPEIAPER